MTTKKYLTTPEEILALKDTDTEIHYGADGNFVMRFVQGVLCLFSKDDNRLICFNEPLSISAQNPYILVEEPVKEADENDIGKLCWFWDDEENVKVVDILKDTSIDPRHFKGKATGWYYHCRPLSPAEVAEITGYKVEE